MPTQIIDFAGLDRIQAKLARLSNISASDTEALGDELERLIVEDNRAGVLSGMQANGSPMKPVIYRPVAEKRIRFPGKRFVGGARPTAYRRGEAFGTPSGQFKGPADINTGRVGTIRNGNLTNAQYERLDGPPLAPRYDKSRVITNLVTSHELQGNTLTVIGAWKGVVDVKGRPFLPRAFKADRDLRGIRPAGMQKARTKVRQWAKWLLSQVR